MCKRIPGNYKKNIKINKILNVKLSKNDYIYHAGTKIFNNNVITNGAES